MSSLSSFRIRGRPLFAGARDRQRQYVFHPLRCQAITASGLTMSSVLREPQNQRLARIQNRRSASVNCGRGCRRWRTRSCWRRQRFSATKEVLDLKKPAITLATHRNTNLSPPESGRKESLPPDFMGRKRQTALLRPTGFALSDNLAKEVGPNLGPPWIN